MRLCDLLTDCIKSGLETSITGNNKYLFGLSHVGGAVDGLNAQAIVTNKGINLKLVMIFRNSSFSVMNDNNDFVTFVFMVLFGNHSELSLGQIPQTKTTISDLETKP